MSFVSTFDHTNPMADKNTNLEMLMQREQLMEDIDGICDEFFYEKYNGDIAERDELTRILCDAVCKNFPTN
jgi:hypothetical protein